MLHIICFGNDLHGDDGFGLAVYLQLKGQLSRCEFSFEVQLYNGGIAGLNALSLFENCDQVYLVDAQESRGNVGKLNWYPSGYLPNFGKINHDGHGVGLPFLLRVVEQLVIPMPSISLLTVDIEPVHSFSPGLSHVVSISVSKAVTQLMTLIKCQSDQHVVGQ
jgi:hydrogenase 3 maturation protease